jgi:hypothetical protein
VFIEQLRQPLHAPPWLIFVFRFSALLRSFINLAIITAVN